MGGGNGMPIFLSGASFRGHTAGYVFKSGRLGLGYYRDDEAAAAEVDAQLPERGERRGGVLHRSRSQSPQRSAAAMPLQGSAAEACGGATTGMSQRGHAGPAGAVNSAMGDALGRSMLLQLARREAWRACPHCAHAVETRRPDGSARCATCGHSFRWVLAPLFTPASSVSQLLREFAWQEAERARNHSEGEGLPVSAASVLRRYCGLGTDALGDNGHLPCTKATRYKLQVWKAMSVVPITLAMPVLLHKERSRVRREEEGTARHVLRSPTRSASPNRDVKAPPRAHSLPPTTPAFVNGGGLSRTTSQPAASRALPCTIAASAARGAGTDGSGSPRQPGQLSRSPSSRAPLPNGSPPSLHAAAGPTPQKSIILGSSASGRSLVDELSAANATKQAHADDGVIAPEVL